MNAPPSFRPRWPWVTADLQTIRNVLPGRLAGIPAESGQRFEIPLRDGSGDRLVARFHPGRKPVPAMVLVPGLTGCEASRYVLQSAGAWLASGAPVVRLNLRGAPPGRSVARGHYHMDRVRDLADACLAVADLDPGIRDRGIAIVGFSLGGALALRLASAPYLPAMVKTVVAVSAPLDPRRLDLAAAADRIARPRNRLLTTSGGYSRACGKRRSRSGEIHRSRCARPLRAHAMFGTSTTRSPQWTRGFATRRTTTPHARRSAASTRFASPFSSCTQTTIPGFPRRPSPNVLRSASPSRAAAAM